MEHHGVRRAKYAESPNQRLTRAKSADFTKYARMQGQRFDFIGFFLMAQSLLFVPRSDYGGLRWFVRRCCFWRWR
jgi:hypothetical protein